MNEEILLKNKQGRPRQRWIDNVLETVNLTKEDATTLAQDIRMLWRSQLPKMYNSSSQNALETQTYTADRIMMMMKVSRVIEVFFISRKSAFLVPL